MRKRKLTTPEILGQWLYEYRIRHKLTLREFSIELGISVFEISKIERGHWDLWTPRMYKKVNEAYLSKIITCKVD